MKVHMMQKPSKINNNEQKEEAFVLIIAAERQIMSYPVC